LHSIPPPPANFSLSPLHLFFFQNDPPTSLLPARRAESRRSPFSLADPSARRVSLLPLGLCSPSPSPRLVLAASRAAASCSLFPDHLRASPPSSRRWRRHSPPRPSPSPCCFSLHDRRQVLRASRGHPSLLPLLAEASARARCQGRRPCRVPSTSILAASSSSPAGLRLCSAPLYLLSTACFSRTLASCARPATINICSCHVPVCVLC
jgi:hypothetical protein